MADYPISYHDYKVSVTGTVSVNYPEANVTAKVKVPACKVKTYKLKIGPDHLQDSQTKKFTFAKIPITVRLDARPDKGVVIATADYKGFVFMTYPCSYTEHEGIHTITAYGVPVFIEALKRYADHTYAIGVNDETGKELIWHCGGDFEGGRKLTTGKAEGSQCDCISRRKEDPGPAGGLAWIRYAVDGVCHQATNRIIYPAGLEVTKAKAYRVSYNLYGRLGLKAIDGVGRKRWRTLLKKCHLKLPAEEEPLLLASEPADDTTLAEWDVAEAAFDFRQVTDGAISEVQCDDLLAERNSVVEIKNELSAAIVEGRISGRELADGINAAVSEYLLKSARIVPPPTYRAIHGIEPEEEILLVNPLIAEAYYEHEVEAPA